MMLCKLCGTNLPDGQLTCPNCGHVTTPGREGERGSAPPRVLDTREVEGAEEREGGEDLVAETLQRIGCVRKHLGKGKQKTRGIVLVEQVPENLSYTAA